MIVTYLIITFVLLVMYVIAAFHAWKSTLKLRRHFREEDRHVKRLNRLAREVHKQSKDTLK